MSSTSTDSRTKAPYEPPRLLAIDLAAEEVLGYACKLGAEPYTGVAGQPCNLQNCATRGS